MHAKHHSRLDVQAPRTNQECEKTINFTTLLAVKVHEEKHIQVISQYLCLSDNIAEDEASDRKVSSSVHEID